MSEVAVGIWDFLVDFVSELGNALVAVALLFLVLALAVLVSAAARAVFLFLLDVVHQVHASLVRAAARRSHRWGA